MSDGNFNRALLPSTPYRSGIKMGQQQLRAKADTVLPQMLKEKFPTITDEELQSFMTEFRLTSAKGKGTTVHMKRKIIRRGGKK